MLHKYTHLLVLICFHLRLRPKMRIFLGAFCLLSALSSKGRVCMPLAGTFAMLCCETHFTKVVCTDGAKHLRRLIWGKDALLTSLNN